MAIAGDVAVARVTMVDASKKARKKADVSRVKLAILTKTLDLNEKAHTEEVGRLREGHVEKVVA